MKTASFFKFSVGISFVVAIVWIFLAYSLTFACLASSRNVSDCRDNSAGHFVAWTLSPFIK